jgi:hypothetical protein
MPPPELRAAPLPRLFTVIKKKQKSRAMEGAVSKQKPKVFGGVCLTNSEDKNQHGHCRAR